jgi:hyaluronoglucosaminidase
VNTWLARTRMVDYASRVDLSGTTIRRDAQIFYQCDLGNYPYPGMHVADSPEYLRAHLAKFAVDIARRIPDANWSGYAVIDWEEWTPIWSRLWNTPGKSDPLYRDHDFKDDWEEHLNRTRPAVLRGLTGEAKERALANSYNTAAQRFFLESLREAKRLRPNAKWGFYGFPFREYYTFYKPLADRWKLINDTEMGWMFDAVDALFPSTYQIKLTVEDREPTRNTIENSPAQNAQYIADNVREAVRISRGKPVQAFIHFKYHPSMGKPYANQWITATNIRQMLEVPKQAGAQGVMIWDCIESEQHFNDLSRIVQSQVGPQMNAIAVNPSGSGSQLAASPARASATTVTRLPGGRIVVSKKPSGSRVASAPE